MKYLEKPCGRCGGKLLPPEKGRSTVLCVDCKKRMGYRVVPHVDGTAGYELYFIGGHGEPKVSKTFRLPERLSDATTYEVKLALDNHRKKVIL